MNPYPFPLPLVQIAERLQSYLQNFLLYIHVI